MPKPKHSRPVLMLLLLPALLSGCASDSSLFVPPAHQPAIPPLPAQARQNDLPKFSENVLNDLEQWQLRLIEPSLQDELVRPRISR